MSRIVSSSTLFFFLFFYFLIYFHINCINKNTKKVAQQQFKFGRERCEAKCTN